MQFKSMIYAHATGSTSSLQTRSMLDGTVFSSYVAQGYLSALALIPAFLRQNVVSSHLEAQFILPLFQLLSVILGANIEERSVLASQMF